MSSWKNITPFTSQTIQSPQKAFSHGVQLDRTPIAAPKGSTQIGSGLGCFLVGAGTKSLAQEANEGTKSLAIKGNDSTLPLSG